MKTKITTFVLFILTINHSISQVICDAKLLPNVTNFCSNDAEYTNVGTPSSGLAAGYCWTDKTATQEIWYKFNAIGTDIVVKVSGGAPKGTIIKPCISLHTGDCTVNTPFPEIMCSDGTGNITELYFGGLTPGVVYYIRIATAAANAGTITLCVDNSTPTANPGSDCEGAVKLCNKNTVTVPGLKGAGKNPNEPEKGTCMYNTTNIGTSERNSCWYYWVCDKSGTLTFELTPSNPLNDLDFNFYSITSGTNVCKNRKIERCSATGKVKGPTGLNMTETDVQEPITVSLPDPNPSNSFVKYMDMVSGTTYALLVNNASDKSGFTIKFGGTGTFVGPTAEITAADLTICPGKTVTFNGNKSINYNNLSWNFVSGGSPTSATGVGPHTIQYNKPGDYVAILKATDTIGCNSVASINVKVINALPVTVSNDSICSGKTATITASPLIPGATYTWTPKPLTGDGTPTITINPTTQQTYSVSIEKDGCISTGTGTVYIKSDVILPILPPMTICIGSSATLTANPSGGSGNYTYEWLPAGTGNTKSVTVAPKTSQQYTVTVNDGGVCPAAPQTVTVSVHPPLAVVVSPPDTICVGNTTTITATASGGNGGPYQYLWQPSGTQTQSIDVSPLVTTTYTVTVSDNCGTPLASDRVTITVIQPIVLTVTTDSVCKGQTATLTASPNIPGLVYSWNPAPDTGNGTPVITTLPAANQTFTVTVSQGGCRVSATGNVFLKPTAVIDPLPEQIICIGNTTKLKALVNGGSGNYTFDWMPAGTGATQEVTVSPQTTQQYTVTVNDGSACPVLPQTVTVVVRPPLTILAAKPDTICAGSSVVLSAKANGGNGQYSYIWNPSASTDSSIVVKPMVTTTYTVIVNDNCGTPPASDRVTITVVLPPVVKFDATNTTGCATPLCTKFIDSSFTLEGKIKTWNWSFGTNSDGTSEGLSDQQHPTHCFNNSNLYTISLTVTNTFGCSATISKPNMVTVYPTPVADFIAPLTTSILNPTVPFTNTTVGGNTWSWNFGDSISGAKNTSTLLHPSHTYSAIGDYCITLIATSIHNCVDTTVKCITINPTTTIFIPNAFTPNGDGKNDFFFAKGENIIEFEMMIFDRWGMLIYYTDNMDAYWDGRVKSDGLIAQQDVYVYKVRAKDIDRKNHYFIGTVTLVR